MKEKAIKIALDAVAILVCSAVANLIGHNVPILSGLKLPMAVAAGVWLYAPLKEKLVELKKKKLK